MPDNSESLRVARRLASANASKSELAAHFELDPSKSRPFSPRFRLKEEASARLNVEDEMIVGSLSLGDFFARLRQRAYREKIAGGWTGLRLVSEGDSWFQYPIVLEDIIDDLFDDYAIYDMSAAGDTLFNIRRGTAQIIDVLRAERSHGLMISSGGNDFLERDVFSRVLRGYDASFTNANQYVIAHRLEEVMRGIAADYTAIFQAITLGISGIKIFCHGYDWAIPRFGGQYLWPVMEEKEIPETLRADITRILGDAFNDMLKRLASESEFANRITYIDCRGAVGGAGQWYDEIHPFNQGFSRVADRFRQVLNRELVA